MNTDGSLATLRDVEHFHEMGYVIFRGMFDAREIGAASAEADRLLVDHADLIHPHYIRIRFQAHAETKEPLFDLFDPVFDLSPALARLGRSERLAKAVSALFGEPACQYKEKLIYRPSGARGVLPHQDFVPRANFPPSYTASIIAIDPFQEDNGCTRVFPGGHKLGYLSPPDGQFYRMKPEQLPRTESVPLLLEPGDMAVFGGLMPHYSEPNRSNRFRRGLFTNFNAFSHGGEQRDVHYRDVFPIRISRAPEADRPLLYFR